MIQSVFVYGLPTIVAIAIALKLRAQWKSGQPLTLAQRDLLLTLACIGLVGIVVLPPVHLALDAAVGIPDLARLLANALTLVACYCAQLLLLCLSESEDRVRRLARLYGVGLLGALVLLGHFFAAASLREEALDFTRRFADAPFILEYKLVYLTGFGLALGNLARLTWRYARLAHHPSLHLGLVWITFGSLSGLLYALHDAGYVVGQRLGLAYPFGDPTPITQALLFVSAGALAVGSTLPEWGQRARVPDLYRWLDHYRSLRRLYPLWRVLYEATPEVALEPPASHLRDVLTVRRLSYWLYRRVVEIRDGSLALRPYRSVWAERTARRLCDEQGVPAEDVPAVVEAACLAAAIRLKRLDPRAAVARQATRPPDQGGADLIGEVVALERLARHFEGSAVVRIVRSRLDAALAAGSLSDSGPTQQAGAEA